MNYESMIQEQKRAYGFIKLTKDQLHIMKSASVAENKPIPAQGSRRRKDHLRLINNN
ncbi:hypothetical protein GZH47_31645 (plasmid) [Paenibacillus rhizovicinus]|uniref:Uncharacterized protein n=1 Tax=Paenibacillus rhizovicinus TaxID=2704463 RepID=A0A6C0PCA5_9BACL|nr:hypothetical protein [Paenibacillus rhizovicinus]QHW35453.1 hypothetical protein GZH47_31645 [Paenibacillus rhizovicinus]